MTDDPDAFSKTAADIVSTQLVNALLKHFTPQSFTHYCRYAMVLSKQQAKAEQRKRLRLVCDANKDRS
jgi:hypothetical protein